MNRYSVTVSITLEIDAESESDASDKAIHSVMYDDDEDASVLAGVSVLSVTKCEDEQ